MSVADSEISHFFKPEVRKLGSDIFSSAAVVLQIAADTQVKAFLKGSARVKVELSSESISDSTFHADCSCPASSKGQFCKHIWAVILAVEDKNPDFLEGKEQVEKGSALERSSAKPSAREKSAAQTQREAEIKLKQSDYRKEQYQKQKQKIKERQGKAKPSRLTPALPEDVELALKFFTENGFTFEQPVDPQEIANARKILSRVFHPDKGGTHDEVLVLNEHSEVLMAWAGG